MLAGTSGAGKGTLGARLREREPDLGWSVSWTTRPPRPGEVDGVDYRFVTRAEFEACRDAGGFLEWFEVYGDLKGTPAAFVRDRLADGGDILLEVDVNGALAVKDALPEALRGGNELSDHEPGPCPPEGDPHGVPERWGGCG